MKSKEEFVKRWQAHIAGLCLFGSWSNANESPLQRGMTAMRIPEEVQKLLGQLYDDLAPKPEPLPVKAALPQEKENATSQPRPDPSRSSDVPATTAIRKNGAGYRG